MDNDHNNRKQPQHGKICVSGTNEVDITLIHNPKHIRVRFSHDHCHTPCDPHHDHCSYIIEQKHNHFILKIKWNVSNVREIVWEAF